MIYVCYIVPNEPLQIQRYLSVAATKRMRHYEEVSVYDNTYDYDLRG